MLNKAIKKTLIILFWILVWQAIASIVNLELILPSPLQTVKALFVISRESEFYIAVFSSLSRIITGFILGVAVGFVSAVLSSRFKLVSELFAPILRLLRAVPVASFIIIAFYWLLSDSVPTLICFLMVLPLIWTTVETALNNIDKRYLEIAKIYRLSGFKTFFGIKLPFIMPNLMSTVLTSLGFAWKSGIAAEIICLPPASLGGLIGSSKSALLTSEVFAITTVVIILSIILESVVKLTLRRFTNDNSK